MAEVKNVQINVDTKSAVNAMENLSKATHDVSASFEEVYGELQPLTTRMGEAEDRLYELANAGQTATQEYQDLLNTVANYRRVQIQTDMAVDAASSTFATKLGGALGGVTAGFSIAQGAMGAFGVESEDLEKQLLKVQSAMAIAEGVRGFKEAIPSIKAFGNAMKAAIGSTGIGLLIVALGTIYAYWDDIKAAVGGVSDEQAKLNAKTDANLAAQEAKYSSLVGQENILKLQGKSEREILLMKQDAIKAVIKETKARLIQQEATKKAQVEAAKRNYDILKLVTKVGIETSVVAFRALAAPLDLVLETANAVADALGFDKITTTNLNKEISKLTETASKGLTKFIFDPEAVENEGNKTIEETKKKLEALENEKAGYELSLQEQSNAAATDASDKRKEELEKLAEYNKDATDLFKSEYDKQVELIKTKYAEQIALAKKYNKDTKDLEAAQAKELEDALDKSMKPIETLSLQKFQVQQKDLGNLRGSLNTELKAKQDAADLEIDILQSKADRARRIEEQSQSFKIKATLDGLSAIASIAELFGKKSEAAAKRAFQVQKAANIASALITTYQNATSAYASQFTPIPTPDSPIRGGIAAGIAVAAGLANVAKISQQKFEGGGSTGGGGGIGGGGSIPSVSPSFNVVGNSGMNQLAQIQQTPIQAYVVSGEVTSAQALDRNRIKNATL